MPQIGDTVEICIEKVVDRLPKEVRESIQKENFGKIIDFKLTDGGGVGVILELPNKQRYWFFESEIKFSEEVSLIPKIKDDNEISNLIVKFQNKNLDNLKANIKYNKSNSIKAILNPLIFINWLIYSLKDII